MMEINKAEFIKDKEYLLTHDLCDKPGLSENQNPINEDNTNVQEKNEIKTKNSSSKDNQKNSSIKRINNGNFGYYFKNYNTEDKKANITPFETPEKEEDDFFIKLIRKMNKLTLLKYSALLMIILMVRLLF